VSECQYCRAELDDRYNFCLNCNRQTRCTNCKELLVRDKRICFICGQPLASEAVAQGQFNEFTLEENQTENSAHRLIKGRFSDDAVAHAATLLGSFTRSRPVAPYAPAYEQPALTPLASAEEQVPEQSNEPTDQRNQAPPPDTLAAGGQDSSDRSRALKLFKQHGENEVIPKLVDFKGKSWKEQQRRFIILYVWAYSEIVGHPVPSKANIIEAAKRVNVYDKNNTYRHYAEFANEYLLSTDQGLELNTRGFQLVEGVVAEMEGSPEGEGYVYWKGTTKPGPKKSTANKKNQQEIDEWVDKPIDIGSFDVRTLSNAAQWAMFAIWSITKRLNVADAVKTPMAYQYLTKKYTTVPVRQNALSEAMRRNNNRFQRTADGRYYLTPLAQQEVESWIKKGTVGETEASYRKE